VTNVRSSTSSSNDRLPRGGWRRTWLVTLLLVVVPLAGWEAWWRARGFTPGIEAADESWVLALHRVPRATTVVLGSSRIEAALDPVAYRRVVGGVPPVNLALPFSSPLPLLEYLADSTRYAGIVIAEILPLWAFDASKRGERRIAGLMARYRRDWISPARVSEDWLQVNLLGHVVLRTAQLLPWRLLATLRAGGALVPGYAQLHADRFAPLNQRALRPGRTWDSIEGFRTPLTPWVRYGGRPATLAEYAAFRQRIVGAVNRIVDRGGTVVLLYMTGCGERRRVEERRYPRASYWDPLATGARAMVIASEDYPQLSHFDCFDGSHLDVADAPAFAAALGALVVGARGVGH